MSEKIILSSYKSPVGELILGAFENKLCLADWRFRKMRNAIDSRLKTGLNAAFVEGSSEVIEKTKQQLERYFNQELTQFDVPLLFVGTEFQKNVWNELLKIPYGNTLSYLALSKQMNNEKAIRAIASANGANAISILVPCHRIIGSNGKLVGYAGGLAAKKKLLSLENAWPKNQLQLF
ncbi:MAG: methylated-DNA--[protein]-cysteine S-methyltransferase [Bacteroidales bacterium]|nr:methylated-DNA--[protein]-cysteine S-methyltransferase [Bacteroidales bacterium]